jgi:hypothetical protein
MVGPMSANATLLNRAEGLAGGTVPDRDQSVARGQQLRLEDHEPERQQDRWGVQEGAFDVVVAGPPIGSKLTRSVSVWPCWADWAAQIIAAESSSLSATRIVAASGTIRPAKRSPALAR